MSGHIILPTTDNNKQNNKEPLKEEIFELHSPSSLSSRHYSPIFDKKDKLDHSENMEEMLDGLLHCRGYRDKNNHRQPGTGTDAEAIWRQLRETETDLHLAAEIGRTLLTQNRELTMQVDQLKKQMEQVIDQRNQLRHEINMKEDLLKMYMSELDANESTELDMSAASPFQSRPSSVSETRTDKQLQQQQQQQQDSTLIELKKRIEHLECDNMQLKLCNETEVNSKDHLLVKDCVRQLTEANSQMKSLSDSLCEKSDRYVFLQSDMSTLLAKNVELAAHIKQLTFENDTLIGKYEESQKQQTLLSSQLMELRDRYDECVYTLATCQEEARRLRKREKRLLLENQRYQLQSQSNLGGGSKSSLLNISSPILHRALVARPLALDATGGDNKMDEREKRTTAPPPAGPRGLDSPASSLKLSDKLKLVKPIEGSSTLRHWQELATPDFARALLESEPPGIQHRPIRPDEDDETPVLSLQSSATSSPLQHRAYLNKQNYNKEIHLPPPPPDVIPQILDVVDVVGLRPFSLIHQLTSVPALANQRQPPLQLGFNATKSSDDCDKADNDKLVFNDNNFSTTSCQSAADEVGLNVLGSMKTLNPKDNQTNSIPLPPNDGNAYGGGGAYVLRRCALPATCPTAYDEECQRRRHVGETTTTTTATTTTTVHVIHRYQT